MEYLTFIWEAILKIGRVLRTNFIFEAILSENYLILFPEILEVSGERSILANKLIPTLNKVSIWIIYPRCPFLYTLSRHDKQTSD